MTTSQTLLLVGVFMLVDMVVVCAVFQMAGTIWNGLGKGCTYVEPAPGAVRKNFQSMKIGIFSYGGCVHIGVDENFLHLYPSKIIRMSGGKAFSVPWELVEANGSRQGRRTWSVRINGQKVLAPAWAMKIAAAGQRAPSATSG